MTAMSTLFTSVEFWFGAIFLSAFQIGKFSELTTIDRRLTRIGSATKLRTIDFVGPRTFIGGLIAYLLFTFFFYLTICLYSPPLIAGWLKVTQGAASAESITETIASLPYPLYIAAVLAGLAQQAIPGISRIGDIQRDVFHFLIGVPRTAIDMAANSAAEIKAKADGDPGGARAALLAVLNRLASGAFVGSLRDYADVDFYTEELDRVLPGEDGGLETLSDRKLWAAIEALVYGGALAAVRKSGTYGLSVFAQAIGTSYAGGPMPLRHFRTAFILLLLGATFILFLLPGLAPLSASPYWPQTLSASASYVVAQMLPVFISVICMVVFVRRSSGQPAPADWISILSRHSTFLLFVLFLIIVYDYAQAFAEFGIYTREYDDTLTVFILSRLPYYVLHAAISLVVCLTMLRLHQQAANGELRPGRTMQLVQLAVATALVAGFYAVCRLNFQFGAFEPDYILLVVILNVAAAVIAFSATNRAFEQYFDRPQLIGQPVN